ncbi:MAG TPA: trypsin-like peptidase domain-containing protein [Acidimicrobiales bacterium]|nr:trypsin-like peptidase domain-containing protein [Acidimicrobiales bacterium]
MEFVEPDDEPQPYRDPPPPDDRLWRHPSEIGPKRSPIRRQLWAVGIASALVASVLSTGLAVVAGTLLDAGDGADGAVSTSSILPVERPASNKADVVAIADRVRPAIAQLKVERGRTGSGSGVLFRSDGHLLTNAHVVDGATSVAVVLSSGKELPARVIGSDAASDTAVVKIDGGPFPVAELGTTTDLKVGQEAIAIGSPLGLTGGPSVTVGIVSALHRTVRTRGGQSLADVVQTDAPIAPGSSGGALLDAGGRVIGITTAVAVTDTGAEGFGFATPIDTARNVAEQLITTGKVVTVWLGVEGSDLDGATALELNVDGGAIIEQVKTDSPAERAGLSARDIVVGVDGKPVKSMGMLAVAVRAHRPGDVITLDVVREKQHHGIKVTVAERPPGS